MASGVIIAHENEFMFMTAAHFMEDVKRWRDEGRLLKLSLLVHHEAGVSKGIAFELSKNPGSFCNKLDFGFVLLDHELVHKIGKAGGKALTRDNIGATPEQLDGFLLVGMVSSHCKLTNHTIARTEDCEWQMTRLTEFAAAVSRLQFDGSGPDPGTYQFVPVGGPVTDFSGTSGGPVFGYKLGTAVRDICLVAFQSKQITSGSVAKPVRLIATSAPIAIYVVAEYIKELLESVE
jgi:hypothetical protein